MNQLIEYKCFECHETFKSENPHTCKECADKMYYCDACWQYHLECHKDYEKTNIGK